MKFLRIAALLLLAVQFRLEAQQLAFPSAEGFGKYSQGGRGGLVSEVTNLQDAGAGSLRQALSTNINQRRTIVFRVSGTIELLSELRINNDSYITIAGQTAPGDGICIKNYPLSIGNSHDLIIRYIRFRPGDEQECGDHCDEIDAMSIRSSYNIIIDHCSFSWSIDADLDLTVETGQSTVQYCILSEALLNSKHPSGAHSMAAGWDGQHGGASYHHNLIASCNSRTPRLDSYLGQISGERDLIDFVNNVIYNWAGYGTYGGEHADANWQNNYYRSGPSTGGSTGGKKDQIFQVDGSCKLFVDGNFVEGYPAVTSDNSKGIYIQGSKASVSQLDTILKPELYTVISIAMESAEECFNSVLAHAGASSPFRDSVDHRIIHDVNERTGKLINSPAEVGGWPILNSQNAPVDSDHDGMPDEWEILMGFNFSDPEDRNQDHDSDGYTNLEEYLNDLIPDRIFINRPGNIFAQQLAQNVIGLNWEDPSDQVDYYVIERFSGENFAPVVSVPANILFYSDTISEYTHYTYRIKAVSDGLESLYTYSERITITEPQSVKKYESHAHLKAFPNPFREHIHIECSLPREEHPRAYIFSISAQQIRELTAVKLDETQCLFSWDGTDDQGVLVPAGIYIIKLQGTHEIISRVIIKY
jgi:pectate lyase